jgi:hypothetical protein
MSSPPGVLGAAQQRALGVLAPVVTPLGWYLAGGTALALQLGHRRSVDLDWFLPGDFQDPPRLAHFLRSRNVPFVTDQEGPGTLHGRVGGVRTTFLEYQYQLLEVLIAHATGARLAGRRDLGAMKLSAVAQRGAKKDFIDVHALLASGLRLPAAVEDYRRKFSVTDVTHLLYSLVYFDEADKQRMPKMLRKVTWREIKAALRDEVRRLALPEERPD